MKKYIRCGYIENYRGYNLCREDDSPQRYYTHIGHGDIIFENSIEDLREAVDDLFDDSDKPVKGSVEFDDTSDSYKVKSTSIKCSSRDPYKVDWLKKALQSMQEDEYFIPRLNVNDNGRHIDLDEGAIQALIDYYN